MSKILVKATAKSFFERLIRRENPILSEWCSFSSVKYVRGFCYVVIDFLRENLIMRAMLLRERNLLSSETQKKRFDIINCKFYESYFPILLRKQKVLFIVILKCVNVNANIKTLMMNVIFITFIFFRKIDFTFSWTFFANTSISRFIYYSKFTANCVNCLSINYRLNKRGDERKT